MIAKKNKIGVLLLLVTFLAIGNIFAQDDPEEAAQQGLDYLNKGDYDWAITECTRALQMDPNYFDAYYNRGLAYYYKGKYDRAISDNTKAIELKPETNAAYINRGLAYCAKGNYDQAIADYNVILGRYPEFAMAYNNRAIAYYYKKDYTNAWNDVHKAEQLGYEANPELLEKLKKDSHRDK